jgi:hypothetical protein
MWGTIPGAGNLDWRSVRFSPSSGGEPGDVDEADDVVRRDDRTAVGMTDQQDRPVDLTNHTLDVVTVAAA